MRFFKNENVYMIQNVIYVNVKKKKMLRDLEPFSVGRSGKSRFRYTFLV